MYCSKCGSKIEKDEKFCKYCGEKIDEYENNNLTYNRTVTDDDLLKEYIGPNYDKIENCNFSIPAFLFGGYYFIYRKMFLCSVVLILLSLSCIFVLKQYAVFGILLIALFFSFLFRNIYISHCKRKIQRIKLKNPSKNNSELISVCKEKGGTSVLILILTIVLLYFIIFVAIIIFFLFWGIDEIESIQRDNNYPDYNTNSVMYTVPDGFSEANYSTDTNKKFRHTDSTDTCSITVTYRSNYLKQSAKEYLEKHTYASISDEVSNVDEKEINDQKWAYVALKNEKSLVYTYVSSDDYQIIEVEYAIYSDNTGYCSTNYEKFINSLKLENNNKGLNSI